MYPTICYSSAPNSAEACCTLGLLAAAAIAASVVLVAAAQVLWLLMCLSSSVIRSVSTLGVLPALAMRWVAPGACLAPGAAGTISGAVSIMDSRVAIPMIVASKLDAAAGAAWAWGTALLAAMGAYKLVDIMLDVARAFTAVSDWPGCGDCRADVRPFCAKVSD